MSDVQNSSQGQHAFFKPPEPKQWLSFSGALNIVFSCSEVGRQRRDVARSAGRSRSLCVCTCARTRTHTHCTSESFPGPAVPFPWGGFQRAAWGPSEQGHFLSGGRVSCLVGFGCQPQTTAPATVPRDEGKNAFCLPGGLGGANWSFSLDFTWE